MHGEVCVSSCTLILQTSMNAVLTQPILVSMLASTTLDRTLAVATMDMCLILMETLVEVSSAQLFIIINNMCHELAESGSDSCPLYNECHLGIFWFYNR